MSVSMHQLTVPVFTRTLNCLAGVLEKAAAHAEAKKIDPAVLVASRLYPNMFPLSRQIQVATDHAKGCAARLAGLEPPVFEDTEASLADLVARINKTTAYLATISAAQLEGSESRALTLKLGGHSLEFIGLDYVLRMALPNFYFHATTAYGILRHNGVELEKRDFLGPITSN